MYIIVIILYYLFRPLTNWVYSTRLSCIDCKQNKLRKDEEENCTQVYFDLLKHLRNLIFFIDSECHSRNTVTSASTSGKNLYKGRNNAVLLYIKFVCQQCCYNFSLKYTFRIYIENKTIYRHSILNHMKSNPDTYIQINIILKNLSAC